ncbi:MAG: metallophosphoesterase [Vicinamibacteria bacterium]
MNPLKDEKISRRRAALWLGLSPLLAAVPRVGGDQKPAVDTPDGGKRIKLPMKAGSLRFAVMGDTGRGDRGQYEMAAQMVKVWKEYPFETMIMVGDNIYGGDSPSEMTRKFETPYKPLIDGGVKFQASIGNHDNPNQRFYKLFNMGTNRFYTFRPPKSQNIRFFAIDSNYIDKEQLDWLERELASSTSDWKIPFFHHPLYSSGATHGSSLETRAALEPLFVKHNVSAVFAGHDHFYQRIKPQKGGIVHWVSGAGGSLRKGDIRASDMSAKNFDTDYHFMICEIAGDEMFFQAISRTGTTVDSGVIRRQGGATTISAPLPLASASPVASASPASPRPPVAVPSLTPGH